MSDGHPEIVELIKSHDITLVITSVAEHEGELDDARVIRKTALAERVTYYTTMAGGLAAAQGIRHMRSVQVYDLQGLHGNTLP